MTVCKKAFIASALALSLAAANAAPVVYTFTTSTSLSADPGTDLLVALLQGSKVSGQFRYNAAAPLFGNSGALGFDPGFAIYVGNNVNNLAFSGLSGHVGSHAFSDLVGSAQVANDNPSTDIPGDTLSLDADPIPKVGQNTAAPSIRPLSGFQVGNYILKNVRLFWTQADGSPAFLNSSALPATLPTFKGHVALDFALASDPNNTANIDYYANTVFFNDLTVTATPSVPEPSSYALALAGLMVLARRARPLARRTQG